MVVPGRRLGAEHALAPLDLVEVDLEQAALVQPPADIPNATRQALGMQLSAITPELRERFNIGENVEGVVVLEIDPNSAAADRRIQLGDVIVEVGQEPVKNPGDISSRIDAIRAEGRRSALFLISNAQGEVRFVALSLQETDN
jgi:serine protease Do